MNMLQAALGNSASLNLSGATGVSSATGQLNTGTITASISGQVSNAANVTAAAIGNSLTVTNSVLN